MVAVAALIALVGVLSARPFANRFLLPDGSVVRFTHAVVTNRLVIPFRGPKLFGVWSDPTTKSLVEVFSNSQPALVLAFELTGRDTIARWGLASLRLRVVPPGETGFQAGIQSSGLSSTGPWFTRDVVIHAEAFPIALANSGSVRIALERKQPSSGEWHALLVTNLSVSTNTP